MQAALSANIAMITFHESTTQRNQSFMTNSASCTGDTAGANVPESHSC